MGLWLSLVPAVCLAIGIGNGVKQDIEFVAHRGESADAPENTLAAFRLAWERKDRAIELDIHLTKDGALIVSHDGNTKRTTGVDRNVKDTPLDELRQLDAGRWKGEKWAGEKLPLLGEVLETIPKGCRCFIEIKTGPEVVPELVKVTTASRKKPEQMVLISFNADALAEAKRRLPKLKAYYLASFRRDPASGVLNPSLAELIRTAKKIHADGLDLMADTAIDEEFVGKVKDAGLELLVWTLDSPDDARKLIAAGVQGITSNRAAELRKEIENGP